MSLSALIRKRAALHVATATTATFATDWQGKGGTVAKVATVAVATPIETEIDKAEHYAWLIHFTDRNPLTVTFSPEVNHAGALALYPDAVAAEPVGKPSMRRILNHAEEVELRALIEAV